VDASPSSSLTLRTQRDSARAHQGAPAPFRSAIKLDQRRDRWRVRLLAWRLAVGLSPHFVRHFTPVVTKGKVQYLCVFLMLGTTFQQPEGTLNTCLRKAHQRTCAIA